MYVRVKLHNRIISRCQDPRTDFETCVFLLYDGHMAAAATRSLTVRNVYVSNYVWRLIEMNGNGSGFYFNRSTVAALVVFVSIIHLMLLAGFAVNITVTRYLCRNCKNCLRPLMYRIPIFNDGNEEDVRQWRKFYYWIWPIIRYSAANSAFFKATSADTDSGHTLGSSARVPLRHLKHPLDIGFSICLRQERDCP